MEPAKLGNLALLLLGIIPDSIGQLQATHSEMTIVDLINFFGSGEHSELKYALIMDDSYLVEKYYDRQTAIFCSKVFQIEMDKQSQAAFTIFAGQKLHGDKIGEKAQASCLT